MHFEEIVELIHREMYVCKGVMVGAKAAAKAIMQAEEAAEQSVQADLGGKAHFGDPCIYCGTSHDDVSVGDCPKCNPPAKSPIR